MIKQIPQERAKQDNKLLGLEVIRFISALSVLDLISLWLESAQQNKKMLYSNVKNKYDYFHNKLLRRSHKTRPLSENYCKDLK